MSGWFEGEGRVARPEWKTGAESRDDCAEGAVQCNM